MDDWIRRILTVLIFGAIGFCVMEQEQFCWANLVFVAVLTIIATIVLEVIVTKEAKSGPLW